MNVAVEAVVPASSANLGPGFDSVGLALGVFDTYRAELTEEPGLVVDLGPDAQGVPADESHLVVATMHRTFDELGVPRPAGLRLTCRNTIRMGRGMGSSAAAIVGGVALACALADPRTAEIGAGEEVALDLAFVNDVAAALEGHPDNSSASVFGGGTLSIMEPREGRTLPQTTTVRLGVHPSIRPVVFLPEARLETATARAVLPTEIAHGVAAANSARVGLLVHALTVDPSLLLSATLDLLHQEQRRPAYPASMALVDELRAQGCAATISGAGPSVLALVTEDAVGRARTERPGWERLEPGVPAGGVRVVRATLNVSPEARTVHQ